MVAERPKKESGAPAIPGRGIGGTGGLASRRIHPGQEIAGSGRSGPRQSVNAAAKRITVAAELDASSVPML